MNILEHDPKFTVELYLRTYYALLLQILLDIFVLTSWIIEIIHTFKYSHQNVIALILKTQVQVP